MPKSKVVKADEDSAGSDVASETPSTTSKKRQLDDIPVFHHFNFQPVADPSLLAAR